MRRSKINNGLISTFGAQIPTEKQIDRILTAIKK
jgi:hypothetical protein